MATHEPELTAPVDLCTPDGRRLNPAARGWSRRPLHRANLRGGWGRTKRWDYWAILAEDLAISATYADVDYLGLAEVWWADLASGATGGRGVTVPLARGFALPERPGTEPLEVRSRRLRLSITDDDRGTRLTARWTERDGCHGRLEAFVADPPGHESLNVVIPWSERRFQYTSKHQARPAAGCSRSATGAGASVVTLATRGGCWTSGVAAGPTGHAGIGAAVPGDPGTALAP